MGTVKCSVETKTNVITHLTRYYESHEVFWYPQIYEGHLESKERFAIKKYLLIIGKKMNMQVLSHTFAYFST